ncbi:S66 peptidase family protein [Acanthopleuribacter pedis]|uniref:LD-carboxypeptidase n=1 Tax=Acanthopleuribacter pedis TaxID=442870 RepID=A0A8J7Q853_9BACT|nr:LD-carboxypeptidase [Acanthopleuribacter pedis]MBO1320206.1 LD-carboxypeptidase [Acanthopleuribacter pedis]
MDRRVFLRAAAGLAAVNSLSCVAAKVPLNKSDRLMAVKEAPVMVRPPRLQSGQTIALIAPASNTRENEDIRFAMDVLDSLGFKVKPGRHLFERSLYLAGDDRNRAADLNKAFADNDVHGIWALRGGYGSGRILPYVDYQTISAHPKVFVGYSDITALHCAIQAHTGLVTFHGPIATQQFSEYALQSFQQVVMEAKAPTPLAAPPPFETKPGQVERENRITRFHGGKARGRLIGGNLSILTQMIGTPYEPQFDGAVLCLEDVNEAPYRIDRMLTHLILSGRLQRVAGIAFGKCTDCTPGKGNSFSLEEVIADRCSGLGVPVVRGLMFGHIEDNATLPFGALAELDGDTGTLTLVESAVA